MQVEPSTEELMYFKRHVSAQFLYAERMLTSILSRTTYNKPSVIIDIDGTIIHPMKQEPELLPGVKNFFKHCRKSGVDVYFLTFRKELGRKRTESLLEKFKLIPYKALVMHSVEEKNTLDSKWLKMKNMITEDNVDIVMCIGDHVTDLLPKGMCNILISNPWPKALFRTQSPKETLPVTTNKDVATIQ